MVSLREIAEEAGVSPSAVSLALRERPGVGDEQRKRIKEIAQKRGYRPNPYALALHGQIPRTVGVIFSSPYFHTRVLVPLIRQCQIQQATCNAIYTIDRESTLRTLEDFEARRVVAVFAEVGTPLILEEEEGGKVRKLLHRLNAVVLSRFPLPDFRNTHLQYDDAMHLLARHWRALGRTPRCFLSRFGSPHKWIPFLDAAGIGPDEGIVNIDYDADAYITPEAVERAFAGREVGDAYLCGNDALAAVFVQWLRGKGLRVPEDVAVAGFDNTPLGPYLAPPLATFDFPVAQIYDCLARELLLPVGDGGTKPFVETVPILPIWRESAGGTGWMAEAGKGRP